MNDDFKISGWLRGFRDTITETKVTKGKILALLLGLILIVLTGTHGRVSILPIVAVIHIWFPEPFSEVYHRGNGGNLYAEPPTLVAIGGWIILLLPYVALLFEYIYN